MSRTMKGQWISLGAIDVIERRGLSDPGPGARSPKVRGSESADIVCLIKEGHLPCWKLEGSIARLQLAHRSTVDRVHSC
jgi:hypothetical protein